MLLAHLLVAGLIFWTALGLAAAQDGSWLKTYPPWSEPGTPTYDSPHVWFPILGPLTRHGCFPSRYMSMRLAVSHINRRDPTFCPAIGRLRNNFQVSYELFDTNGNGVGAVEALLTPSLRLGNKTKVVLGPNSSGSSRSAANLLTVFGIPNLSWAATSSTLSDKIAYPYFSRVVAPDALAMGMLADLVYTYIGSKVNILSSDTDFSAGQATDFRDAAVDSYQLEVQTFSFPNSGSGGAPISEDSMEVVLQRLESIRITLCRVVVASAINEEAWDLVRVAFGEGMIRAPGWVWLGGDGFAGSQLRGDVARTEAFNGFIYIVASSRGDPFEAFSAKWAEDMPSTATPEFFEMPLCRGGVICSEHPEHNNFNTSGQREELVCTGYTPLAYDAAVFIAVVADLLIGDPSNPRHPNSLTADDWAAGFESMQNQTNGFDCLSGFTVLDEKHDRRMSMSYFNIQNGTLEPTRVATWSAATTYVWEVGSTLVWPSGWSGSIVEGSAPPFIPTGAPPECDAGFELIDDVCFPCTRGYYSEAVPGVPCLPCEAGRFQDQEGGSECSLCPQGTFSDEGSAGCQQCLPGFSTLGRDGEGECTECRAGKYQPDSGQADCLDCLYGTTSQPGATDCFNCSAGSSTEDERGAESCTPCAIGRFSSFPGQAECTLCTVGRYADEMGLTECFDCGAGTLWSTMQIVVGTSGLSEWAPFQGAKNISSCGCAKDARLDDSGECVTCTEGLECLGMNDVFIAKGYFADAGPLSIYRCHGDEDRCAGGPAGATCAAGRTGVTCADCQDAMTPQGDGTCTECEGSDLAPFLATVACGVVLLIFAYHFVDTQNRATQSHALLLCAMTWGMLVTLTQQLGVITELSVEWVEPIRSVMSLVQIFSLDVEVLRLNCVSTQPPVQRYMTKLFIIVSTILLMHVIHVLFVLLRHRGRFRAQTHSLVGSVGTLFMVFFISVTTIVLAPFQCEPHPNDKWTVRSFQSVLCWESDDHITMIIFSIVAFLLIPVLFYSICIYVVRQFPTKMRLGDTAFLKAFAFLFFRFRSERHTYVLLLMLKSFLVACILVIPDTVLQIFTLEVLLLVGMVLVLYYMPWRVFEANLLDCFSGGAALLTVCLASLFLQENKNFGAIAWLAFSVVVGILALTPITIAWGLYRRFRHLKPFQFFLSHHKAASGAYTRLLKLHLCEHEKVKGKVFVDSDNLDNLDRLFDYVGSDTETLVILATDEIFTRPWCVGEMCMAQLKQLKCIVLCLPSCRLPDPAFIVEFEQCITNIEVLTENGMSIPMLQDTLEWVGTLPQVAVPPSATTQVMTDVVQILIKKIYPPASTVTIGGKEEEVKDTAIIFDTSNLEAAATSHLLTKLLIPLLSHATESVPISLEGRELPRSVRGLVVVCTNGIVENEQSLRVFQQAGVFHCTLLPIIAEQGFRFPSKNIALQLKKNSSHILAQDEIPEVARVITDIFKEIAITFLAQFAGEQVLQIGAQDVAKRLNLGSHNRKMGSQSTLRHIKSNKDGDDSRRFSVSSNSVPPSVDGDGISVDGSEAGDSTNWTKEC